MTTFSDLSDDDQRWLRERIGRQVSPAQLAAGALATREARP